MSSEIQLSFEWDVWVQNINIWFIWFFFLCSPLKLYSEFLLISFADFFFSLLKPKQKEKRTKFQLKRNKLIQTHFRRKEIDKIVISVLCTETSRLHFFFDLHTLWSMAIFSTQCYIIEMLHNKSMYVSSNNNKKENKPTSRMSTVQTTQ